MNICFVSYEYPPNIFGGSGTYAALLVKGLEKFDINLHLITHGPKNVFKENFAQLNTPDITAWRRLYFTYYAQRLIKKLDEKENFDLIHYNEPHLLLSTIKKPVISTFHSTQVNEFRVNLQPFMRHHVNFFNSIPKNIIGSIGDVFSSQKSDTIICPCNDLKKYIRNYCFHEAKSIKVIFNGIDISTYEMNYDDIKVLNKYSLEKENYILFVGRLDPIKGIDVLINAFKKISIDFPKLKLAIMGSGILEHDLKNLVQNNKKVVFLGHISNVQEKVIIFKNSIFFALPSYYEALPMVILESMAAARPVISTRVGGTPEVVEDGVNGFLVNPGDSIELSEAIKRLLNSPDIISKMSKINYEKAKEKFGYMEMARQVYSIYENTISKQKLKT
jgi:alpha-maltose-1-phosphate synthase